MRVYHVHGTAVMIIVVSIVRVEVQFKSFQARSSMKDGECDFKMLPDCSLL
jgi:hypothetical protein